MEQMKKLGFLGYGNMASAIAEGLVKQGLIEAANVYAYDPSAERSAAATKNGFVVCASAQALAAAVDTLVLAVKPQMMDSALQELAPGLSQDTRVISIAAGISIDFIQKHLDPAQRILRVMPNTPALAQAGAAAIAPSAQCTADDTAVTKAIFEAVGIAEIVEEKDIDAVTGLSGSGPAYFFYMVECMVEAGIKEGLERRDCHASGQPNLAGLQANFCNPVATPPRHCVKKLPQKAAPQLRLWRNSAPMTLRV